MNEQYNFEKMNNVKGGLKEVPQEEEKQIDINAPVEYDVVDPLKQINEQAAQIAATQIALYED